jgi:hypothetical protein
VREFAAVEEATKEARAAVWPGQTPAPVLAPVLKTRQETLAGSPLFLDMTDFCDILLDADGFLSGYLEGLRRRMADLGTRRRQAKGGYYWDYRPVGRPGEVVEL